MYISQYASTFNTKFNIQIEKATRTTLSNTLLLRVSTECNILDYMSHLETRILFLSWVSALFSISSVTHVILRTFLLILTRTRVSLLL